LELGRVDDRQDCNAIDDSSDNASAIVPVLTKPFRFPIISLQK
jgi:hypothetical protein